MYKETVVGSWESFKIHKDKSDVYVNEYKVNNIKKCI